MTPRKIPKDLPPGRIFTVERGLWVRKRADGSLVWGISYMHNYTLVRKTIGPYKSEARDALEARRTDIKRGQFNLPQYEEFPDFGDFADIYIEHAKQHKRTWKCDQFALKRISAFLAPKRIDQVTPWDIERFKARRREHVTPATVNRDLALLRRMFNLARQWGYSIENPLDKVSFFKEPEKLIRVLTPDEENALCHEAAHHLHPLIRVAVNTGLRRGELLSLQWEQVDLHQRILTVKESKSGRTRHVPINDVAFNNFRVLPGSHDTGTVFKFEGSPIQDVKTAFNNAVRRSGIRRCRFHDLRHTFATRLVLAGVDLATVKELMGHANISTTMKYAHPGPEHKRAAVNRLLFATYNYKSRAKRNKSVTLVKAPKGTGGRK